ncbi:hypothetical protein [Rickettsiella endosymbiont of Miltochrista miniata]
MLYLKGRLTGKRQNDSFGRGYVALVYSQQSDFWQGAARMKQPECIQDT